MLTPAASPEWRCGAASRTTVVIGATMPHRPTPKISAPGITVAQLEPGRTRK